MGEDTDGICRTTVSVPWEVWRNVRAAAEENDVDVSEQLTDDLRQLYDVEDED